jgi:KDO2-lipid IV(A) lauroyltransferase
MAEAQAPQRRQGLMGGLKPASFGQRVLYALEYALFASVMALFKVLGLERASDFGGWIARNVGPKVPVSRRAQRNLQRAMPELSADERDRIVRAMWDNLGRTFAEYPHLEKFWALKPGARIEIVNKEAGLAAAAKGMGGFYVSGHFANWEVMAICIRDAGLKGTLVYRAPNNPMVAAWITNARGKNVLPLLAPKGADGARMILAALKQKSFLAMLVDQKMNDGIEAPFFGIPAMTTAGPAQLSLKFGAPIVPVFNERLPGQRFRITVYPEITAPLTGDRQKDVLAITTKLNEFLEARIRERPEMWLWLHNRWPKV